jgi:hypothetical protein
MRAGRSSLTHKWCWTPQDQHVTGCGSLLAIRLENVSESHMEALYQVLKLA